MRNGQASGKDRLTAEVLKFIGKYFNKICQTIIKAMSRSRHNT